MKVIPDTRRAHLL